MPANAPVDKPSGLEELPNDDGEGLELDGREFGEASRAKLKAER